MGSVKITLGGWGEIMTDGIVRDQKEIINYIQDIKAKLMLDKLNNLIIWPRQDMKNQQCMAELGLRHNDVADILLKLSEGNYLETVPDYDRHGEWLWIFNYQYYEHQIYIKIKLRERVICVSFHE